MHRIWLFLIAASLLLPGCPFTYTTDAGRKVALKREDKWDYDVCMRETRFSSCKRFLTTLQARGEKDALAELERKVLDASLAKCRAGSGDACVEIADILRNTVAHRSVEGVAFPIEREKQKELITVLTGRCLEPAPLRDAYGKPLDFCGTAADTLNDPHFAFFDTRTAAKIEKNRERRLQKEAKADERRQREEAAGAQAAKPAAECRPLTGKIKIQAGRIKPEGRCRNELFVTLTSRAKSDAVCEIVFTRNREPLWKSAISVTVRAGKTVGGETGELYSCGHAASDDVYYACTRKDDDPSCRKDMVKRALQR